MIGSIAARGEDGEFNLGFLLARSHWGRGYMPEAIIAVVDWAFTQPWVSRVWAACDVENRSSARALEKAGFIRAGVLPQFSVHPNISSVPRDCYAYAVTPLTRLRMRYLLSGPTASLRHSSFSIAIEGQRVEISYRQSAKSEYE